MPPTPAKASIFDFAAVVFGVWAGAQAGFFFRILYFRDPGLFALLFMLVLGPAAIAGVLLLITYRKEIRHDPAATVAALLTVAAVIYLGALPFAFGAHGLFAEHLVTEWKLYVWSVAAIVFVDQKITPVIRRFYEAAGRVLHTFLPAKSASSSMGGGVAKPAIAKPSASPAIPRPAKPAPRPPVAKPKPPSGG